MKGTGGGHIQNSRVGVVRGYLPCRKDMLSHGVLAPPTGTCFYLAISDYEVGVDLELTGWGRSQDSRAVVSGYCPPVKRC